MYPTDDQIPNFEKMGGAEHLENKNLEATGDNSAWDLSSVEFTGDDVSYYDLVGDHEHNHDLSPEDALHDSMNVSHDADDYKPDTTAEVVGSLVLKEIREGIQYNEAPEQIYQRLRSIMTKEQLKIELDKLAQDEANVQYRSSLSAGDDAHDALHAQRDALQAVEITTVNAIKTMLNEELAIERASKGDLSGATAAANSAAETSSSTDFFGATGATLARNIQGVQTQIHTGNLNSLSMNAANTSENNARAAVDALASGDIEKVQEIATEAGIDDSDDSQNDDESTPDARQNDSFGSENSESADSEPHDSNEDPATPNFYQSTAASMPHEARARSLTKEEHEAMLRRQQETMREQQQ